MGADFARTVEAFGQKIASLGPILENGKTPRESKEKP